MTRPSALRRGAQSRPQHKTRLRRFETLESRRLLAVVAGEVFFDTNANGLLDPAESGAADVSVVLQDASGTIVQGPVMTDSAGNYAFSSVPDGDYQVALQFSPGSDQLQSTPGDLTLASAHGDFRPLKYSCQLWCWRPVASAKWLSLLAAPARMPS